MSLSILLMFEYPTVNGGENSLLAMTAPLMRLGVRFIAAAPPAGPLAERLSEQNIPIHPHDLFDETGRRRGLEECRSRIEELLKRIPVDVVHSNSLAMSRIVGPVAHEAGVPSIGHLRDIINISRRATADVNLNQRILTVSAATRDHHCRAGLSPEKTFVLYNGVDLTRHAEQQVEPVREKCLHVELGIPESSPIALSVGQIILRKGLSTLLSAAISVAEQNDAIHFVHAGARYSEKQEAIEHEAELLRMSQSGKLSGRFHFLGTRSDVPSLMANSTILVHTAKQEPLGRVLLEAGAAGLPIIATNVGGTREIISTKDCGSLIAVDNHNVLANEIITLAADNRRRHQLIQNMREVMEQKFDVVDRATELLNHYKTLAQN